MSAGSIRRWRQLARRARQRRAAGSLWHHQSVATLDSRDLVWTKVAGVATESVLEPHRHNKQAVASLSDYARAAGVSEFGWPPGDCEGLKDIDISSRGEGARIVNLAHN